MPFSAEVDELAKSVRDFTAIQLRTRFPYMKTQTLEKLLDDCGMQLQLGILQQQTEMRETLEGGGFMSLPPELRNTIYEMALYRADDEPVIIDKAIRSRGQAALLCASRTVHQETRSMLCGANTFKYNISIYGPPEFGYRSHRWSTHLKARSRDLVEWLHSIGSNVALIKSIVLELWADRPAREVLAVILGSAFGLRLAGPTTHQAVLKTLGLHGVGVADEIFRIKIVTSLHWQGQRESVDFYEAAGIGGDELFSSKLLTRLASS
ncbi:hypothetical protein CKM354_001178100 [Cercospora kikuchii]|uniref:Uncharacterized protein n=1 Tax=Cercospora kikuchii TaxID=84275 RepID=A0A9P3CTP7_9PEZI|nr:uncharacterized protein CKM354_001178100 [Cercospora kikuchii]GIZ48731.1 hypothetical protein CKM354_001178100 [Cercospora kikuchii]